MTVSLFRWKPLSATLSPNRATIRSPSFVLGSRRTPTTPRAGRKVGAIAATMAPWEELRRAIALVSRTFAVSLDDALDMDLVELLEWVGEAVDLRKRLYGARRRR